MVSKCLEFVLLGDVRSYYGMNITRKYQKSGNIMTGTFSSQLKQTEDVGSSYFPGSQPTFSTNSRVDQKPSKLGGSCPMSFK